jgi:hypothetical protein
MRVGHWQSSRTTDVHALGTRKAFFRLNVDARDEFDASMMWIAPAVYSRTRRRRQDTIRSEAPIGHLLVLLAGDDSWKLNLILNPDGSPRSVSRTDPAPGTTLESEGARLRAADADAQTAAGGRATSSCCWACGATGAAQRCGACVSALYCDGACQRADWPQHKSRDCKTIVRNAAVRDVFTRNAGYHVTPDECVALADAIGRALGGARDVPVRVVAFAAFAFAASRLGGFYVW